MGPTPYAYPHPYPYPYPYPYAYAYAPPATPGGRATSRKRWYGWQILTATLALDATAATAFFVTPPAVAVSALVARGLAGPIVHLVHHHSLKALASFALEGVLPAVFVAGAFLQPCHQDICIGQFLAGVVGLPIALTAGTAIDSAALAWEDRPAARAEAPGPTWSLAPLTLPALHAGSTHPGPLPAGAALVGTF